MPPKVKITKEDIINTALELVRANGEQSVNARNIASALNCSTQPVFSNFATMDDLRLALLEKINSLLENSNMSPAEIEKLTGYKAQAEEILEIIHTPKEYISLRFFYFVWDFFTWTYNGINWVFTNLFNIC